MKRKVIIMSIISALICTFFYSGAIISAHNDGSVDDQPIVESVPTYANYGIYVQRVGSSTTCRVYISINSNETINSLNIGNLTIDDSNNHVIQYWSNSVSISGFNSNSVNRLIATIYNVPTNSSVHISGSNISVVLDDYGTYYLGNCEFDFDIDGG